jgi:UDP-2,3-diacylglucosamine pyrophosphatase LpxH
MTEARPVDLCVISDVHLGTFGCHASELFAYLNAIKPSTLILNGDIIDIWQFTKRYWPKSHHKVMAKLVQMMADGTEVIYITGNHDEMLRKFTDFKLGNFSLCNKYICELDGKKYWFFHGDVFDLSIQHAKWLAKLGGIGYDILILMNRLVNFVLTSLGRKRISLSKRVKNAVKKAVSFISDFEQTAVEMAVYHGFQGVICGHIHQFANKQVWHQNEKIHYLNSGDWVENCTALEYHQGLWTVHHQPMGVKQSAGVESDLVEFNDHFIQELSQVLVTKKKR